VHRHVEGFRTWSYIARAPIGMAGSGVSRECATGAPRVALTNINRLDFHDDVRSAKPPPQA
jgi:hypothetical protein